MSSIVIYKVLHNDVTLKFLISYTIPFRIPYSYTLYTGTQNINNLSVRANFKQIN